MRYTNSEFQKWADEKYDEVVSHKQGECPVLVGWRLLSLKERMLNRAGKYWMKLRLKSGLFDFELLWIGWMAKRNRGYKTM